MSYKLSLRSTTGFNEDEKIFQFLWTIPNWKALGKNEELVNSHKLKLYLREHIFNTKPSYIWEVGLKVVDYRTQQQTQGKDGQIEFVDLTTRRARVYLKLMNKTGFTKQLHAKTRIQLLNSEGVPVYTDEKNDTLCVNGILEETRECLDVPQREDNFINSHGSIVYAISLSIMPYHLYKLNEFCKLSTENMYENLSALLYNEANADIKIITKHGTEVSAHKAILRIQCPVFAVMFKAEMDESTSGKVTVDDISEDTMKILLHYFYTGRLLQSWKSDDIIVEFMYAAGKYQLKNVLELLNAWLGAVPKKNVTHLEVQLLNLADKLSLKNAEDQLLRRIVSKVSKITTSDEMFDLFNFDKQASRKNYVLQTDEILNIWEYSLGNSDQQDTFATRGLSLLALIQMKNSMKNIETNLLQRFSEAAEKCTSAVELFAIFGYGRQNE